LAAECTAVIHGADTVRSVEAASRILFSASDEVPDAETVAMLGREMPVTQMQRGELDGGIGLVDLLVKTKLAESKGAARKLIESGGLYLNNARQGDAKKSVTAGDLKWPGAILLRAGKKNYHLVAIA
jgi:tyrosyl-tRNA synthetase